MKYILTIYLTFLSTPLQAESNSCIPIQDQFIEAKEERSSFFETSRVQHFKLSAPFAPAFDLAQIGKKEKNLVGTRDFTPFIGVLSYTKRNTQVDLPVQLRVRGETSPKWAKWPKLHMKFKDKTLREQSVFNTTKKIKIGTHMRDNRGTKSSFYLARLLNELSPHREAYVYKLMKYFMLPSGYSRPVKIDYQITGNPQDLEDLERNAFFFEHKKEVAKRYGIKVLKLEGEKVQFGRIPVENSLIQKINIELTTKVHFFVSMIGQFDFALPLQTSNDSNKRLVKNIYLLEDSCNNLFPIAADFDLASIVTGQVEKKKHPSNFFPRESSLYRFQRQRLERVQSEIEVSLFQKTIEEFNIGIETALNRIKFYPMDPVGKQLVQDHLNTFKKVLQSFK